MRAAALPFGLLLCGLVACCGTIDRTTDVSTDDYRAALAQIDHDVRANLVPTLEKLRDEDLARPIVKDHPELGPQHEAAWWSAKIGLARDVAILASDVRTGTARTTSSSTTK